MLINVLVDMYEPPRHVETKGQLEGVSPLLQ